MIDRELDKIYTRVTKRVSPSLWRIRPYVRLASKLMQTFLDLTEITERIDNSLKVTEDVYYARIYTSALELFKVHQWESDIKRKLDITSKVYEMMYRQITSKRTEFLELIIIILIAMEIILFFFGLGG